MTTEYSVSVDEWDFEGRWEYIGTNLMYEHYLEDPIFIKECEENGWDIDEIARRRSDDHFPMMLYAYPLYCTPSDEKIKEVCMETNCTVVLNNETGDCFLALTGGGMDLSQDIALAYLIAEGVVPSALAYNVCTQYAFSVSKEKWYRVMEGCRKALHIDSENYRHQVEKINKLLKERRF